MMSDSAEKMGGNNYNEDNLKFVILRYLKYWPYFVLSILLCIVLAFLYLKQAVPIYNTTAEIKILDEDETGIDLSGLSSSKALFNYSKVNLENEIQIFKSRRLLSKVVEELGLRHANYKVGDFKNELLFGDSIPYEIEWLKVSDQIDEGLELHFIDSNSFQISLVDSGDKFNFHLNDTIQKFNSAFIVSRNLNYNFDNSYINNKYLYQLSSKDRSVTILSKSIIVEPISDKSDILSAKINGPNKIKNEAILNSLVYEFNKDGIEDRRLISKSTKEFVEERLEFLVEELDTVETNIVDFKEDNNVLTIESSVQQLFTKESVSDAERFNLATQLAITKDFRDYLFSNDKYELLPTNLGINSPEVNQLTSSYNELILERQRLSISSTEENPVIVELDQKLDNLRKNMSSSLDNYIESLQVSYAKLTNRQEQFTGEINSLPEKEKELRTIIRQQGVKERLYVFLLQKREEAALSYAVTAPTIKIVDYAYTNSSPVSPQARIIILGSVILGLGVPFGILYLFFMLKTSIENREQLERLLSGIPLIGEIPHLANSQEKLIIKSDQSILAESFRILRTNLFHNFNQKNTEKGKIIFVTSSIKGEGKTFTAVNLASIIASSSKKVLLVGCDLRNPQIHQYFKIDKNNIGLSDYLFNVNSNKLDDYIQKDVSHFDNLDVITSGSVPPNPAELLMNDKFSKLIENAEYTYDYIVIDTAPTIYVTDTLLIGRNADMTVYVVKQDLTDSNLIDHIVKLNKSNKFNNLSVVLNGVTGNVNFGYGYGYIYNDKKKFFWKFWK